MISLPATLPPPSALAIARREVFAAGLELTKPRITRLVVITAAVGFALSLLARDAWTWPHALLAALACLLGTALSAAGANTLNQVMERRRDALMPRTQSRPLPTGRIAPNTSFTLGLLLATAGVTLLLSLVGPAPALVSLVTIVLYTLVYTPLKPVTIWATIVGAIPGALPPLIGWTAAASTPGLPPSSGWGLPLPETDILAPLLTPLAEPGGWSLFILMFVWQLPHFWAIAWMYRDDYARGGHRMLPIVDASGRLTAAAIAFAAALQIPATLLPAWAIPGVLSPAYVAIAALSGLAYFALTLPLLRTPSVQRARRVFIASIIHLPLLLLVMTVDAVAVAVLA